MAMAAGEEKAMAVGKERMGRGRGRGEDGVLTGGPNHLFICLFG